MSEEIRREPLPDGWEIEVVGAVVDDGGWSGGHTGSMSGLAFEPGTPPAVVEAELARLRADEGAAAARERRFAVTLRRGALEVAVHDEVRTATTGAMQLHWPPVVGPRGVLLRRSLGRAEPHGDRIMWANEMLRPWLVNETGAIAELPLELAVSPLCVLPDGRFLLPGSDPLWRDDCSEPLSAMALDGTTEPLMVGGEPLTPPRVVVALVPDWAPAPGPGEDEFLREYPWTAMQARVAASDGASELRIAFVDGDPDPEMTWEAVRWLHVAVPLDGHGELRLIARGSRPEGVAEPIPSL